MIRRGDTLPAIVDRLQAIPEDRGVTFVDVRFRESRWSWRRLHEEAAATAAELAGVGVRPGQTVLLPLATRPESVVSFLGVVLAGAVPATVPGPGALARDGSERRLRELATRHGVAAVLRPTETGRSGVLPTDIAWGATPLLELGVGRGRGGRLGSPTPSLDDLALVQFSSGTTRRPRGVELTHRAVIGNLELAAAIDQRHAGAVHVSWLPLYHDMGLVGGLLASLPAGHELVLMDPACFVLKPVSWLEALSRHRATSTAAPNFALAVTCERVPESQLRRRQLDLSSVRSVFNGAEPVRPMTVRRFEERLREHGLRPRAVRPVYGLAEATLVVTAPEEGAPLVTRRVDGLDVPSVGHPLGDFEVRVVPPGAGAARPLPPGTVGEILLRGSCVARGYHRDAPATRQAFTGGFLRTGDLGLVDEEGRLFVTGRLKDVLIVAGRNYYAHEIGDVVDELPFARRGHSHAVAVRRRDDTAADRAEEIVVLLSPAHPLARRLARGAESLADRADRLGAPGRALGVLVVGAARAARHLFLGESDPRRLERLSSQVDPLVRQHVQRELGLAVDRVVLVPRLPKTTSGKVLREACERLARVEPTLPGPTAPASPG